MNKLTNKFHINICTEVSKELGIPYKVVEEIFRLHWKCIADGIAEVPILEVKDPTDLVFPKGISYTVKGLGKFYFKKETIYNYQYNGKKFNRKNNS